MTISPWVLLALAIPVLLIGELLVRNVRWLARFDLPASIVGGLAVAFGVLFWNVLATPAPAATGMRASATQAVATTQLMPSTTPTSAAAPSAVKWNTKANAPWWTWLVLSEREWHPDEQGLWPGVDVYVPFSTAFFTSLGLVASWRVVRSGSWQLLLFLVLASVLAVVQNVVGVAMAKGMGQNGVLGLLCGGVTLTGGLNTAFANENLFRNAGFAESKVVGAAATMFGIVIASIFAGALGGALIRHRHLARTEQTEGAAAVAATVGRPRRGFFDHLAVLVRQPGAAIAHLLLIFVCMKAGAWLYLWLKQANLSIGGKPMSVPVYLPSLVLGIAIRNVADLIHPRLIRTEIVERIGGVALGIFLVSAICSLDLLALRSLAGPMLAILAVQVVVMFLFAALVTFFVMGRDYNAALMSSGHVGFGLGMTTNAIATMDVLAMKFGPAPRAFLVVSLVGGFLIDITNSLLIAASMSFI